MRFFRFPKEPQIRDQWIQSLKVVKLKSKMYACKLHFDEKLWTCSRLRKDALPTNNLPGNGKYSHLDCFFIEFHMFVCICRHSRIL